MASRELEDGGGRSSSFQKPSSHRFQDDLIQPENPPTAVESTPLLHIRSNKDAETEIGSKDEPLCRICLDSGGDDMISPCRCRGTQKYVHRSCLDNWRAVKEGFAFSHCTECRATFHMRANVPPDRWWRKLKFQLLVMRDHAAIIIFVQLIVASLGVMIYFLYGKELKEMFGYQEHPYGFYSLAVIVAVLSGLSYGFFVAIICGQRISNRHFHVLAKQQLSHEYIVENINEDEGEEATTPSPTLDPNHIIQLRRLGLY